MSGNPANGKAAGGVFDLEDAARAAATEAAESPFTFAYKGATYEVPAGKSWPVSALTALAAGELEAALGVLLGAETFGKLSDAGLTVGELNTLFEAVGKSAGFPSLPNSPPPLPRNSSPRPSRH